MALLVMWWDVIGGCFWFPWSLLASKVEKNVKRNMIYGKRVGHLRTVFELGPIRVMISRPFPLGESVKKT